MSYEVHTFDYRKRVTLKCEDPTRTQQNHVQDTLIENILKKYQTTGLVVNLNKQEPQYGEFPKVVDYKESLDAIRNVESEFAALDSHTRKKYDNDVMKFVEAVENGSFTTTEEDKHIAIQKEKEEEFEKQLELEEAIEKAKKDSNKEKVNSED